MKILRPKLDIIFKSIFGNDNNAEIITELISVILNIPKSTIKEITIMNVEIPNEEYEQKFGRLDLRIKVNKNDKIEIISIEIQVLTDKDYRERTLWYWSKNFSTQLKTGEPYSNLPKVICINIINFNLFKCKDYRSKFLLTEEKRKELLTDKIEIYFLELRKFRKYLKKKRKKNTDPITALEKWLAFIDIEKEGDLMELEKTLSKDDETLNKAIVILKTLSGDEKTRELAFLKEQRLHDEASAIKNAEDIGISKGIKRGIKQGKNEERASLNLLNSILLKNKRYDDLERSTTDKEFQQQLINELLPKS